MAIDRGPWNALVDDDGSNLVGTIWNKDKIKTVILDPVDAELLDELVNSTATGTIHDWAPPITTQHATIVWSGAAALTVTGLAGGVPGQYVTVKNVGSAILAFVQNSASSLAAHRFLNMATSAPTPIAPGGAVTYVHLTDAWHLVMHEQGAWITPPFSAADYSGNVGAWAVDALDVLTCEYRLSGRTLHVSLFLSSTNVSGAPTYLRRTLPGGFGVPAYSEVMTRGSDAGGPLIVMFAAINTGSPALLFYANISGTVLWTNTSSNNTRVIASFTTQVT